MKPIQLLSLIVLILLVSVNACAAGSSPDDSMTVQSVRYEPLGLPVLVGNEHNPVTLVKVDSPGNVGMLRVREFELQLDPAIDPQAIASVEVYATGPRSSLDWRDPGSVFDEAVRLGEAHQPQPTMLFPSDWPLADGENYFWVSYRLKEGIGMGHVPAIRYRSIKLDNGETVSASHVDDPARRSASQRIGVALRNTGDEGVAAYRIPGFATTNAGTLIAVYDIRYANWSDLPGNIDIGMSRSTDAGLTWDAMKVIGDMGDDPKWSYDGIGDPAVLVDEQTGTIWVAGLWSHGERGWHGSEPGLSPETTGQIVLFKSDDDGLTWSRPINITEQIKDPTWRLLFNGPGRGITMRNGTIVFAGQFKDAEDMPYATIIFSEDHGATWHIGAGAKSDTTEAQVAELDDGSLMLNMRDNRGGSRSVAITHDMGKTWRPHASTRSALPEPVCQASLLAVDVPGLDRRVLLFSNPAVTDKPRRNMTIKASFDGGLTWPVENHLLIDAGQSAGYSCLTMIDPQTVGILFEGSRANLTFMSIPLEEILKDMMPNP